MDASEFIIDYLFTICFGDLDWMHELPGVCVHKQTHMMCHRRLATSVCDGAHVVNLFAHSARPISVFGRVVGQFLPVFTA